MAEPALNRVADTSAGDREALIRRAIDLANTNALRLALYQHTGDPALAAMKPAPKSIRGGALIQNVVADEDVPLLKRKAIDFLLAAEHPVPAPPAPGPEQARDLIRLFNSQPVSENYIHRFGAPGIMNTDQGSQFTSFAWTDRLKRLGARISMDGKGRCIDNVFIERLWRSLKYECVYLHAWETGSQAKEAIGRWITFYNHRRPHTAHGGQPPAVVYFNSIETDQQAQRVA